MSSLFARVSRYFGGSTASDTVECSCGHQSPRAFRLEVPVLGTRIALDILGPMPVGHLPYERSLGVKPDEVRPHLCVECLAEEVKTNPSVLISYRFTALARSTHDLFVIADWMKPTSSARPDSVAVAPSAADACTCEGCPA